LSTGEALDFTYGALFHPWLIEREEEQTDRLTRMPPCGAVAGLFADRALNRGAWVAPANQPMRGVVALDPSLQPSRRLDLQEAHINVVRQEPRGFLVLDAETLSDDPDLIQMNVRRLLILLRRQALKVGATYVFEPNSPAFRRAVDVGFTNMLDRMFERGAFAGATPASAYQGVTDASLNTPQSVEQGRFIVELRVAPSLPMTFLTIRLVQTSDRSLALEVH
jgi:phage tail sheath protein FI